MKTPKGLEPTLPLLCKLGSIAVHAEEYLSDDGNEFDKSALQSLLEDRDVRDWLFKMDKTAMLPKKRKNVSTSQPEDK